MNTRDHKVQRVLLEIINTEQETYQDDEEAFSNIINDTLTRVLEELLDEINVTSETIRISQLTIDLGIIGRPFDIEAITAAFKERLRMQLSNELQNETQKENSDDTRIEVKKDTEAEALIWFLKNGTLPWWADKLPSADKWKEAAFRNALNRFLFANATPSVTKRLIKQFTNSELRIILQSLVAQNSMDTFVAIDKIIESLIQSSGLQKQMSAKQLIRKAFEKLIEGMGNLETFEDFITEFITEDEELQKLNLEETAAYLGDLSIIKMEKVLLVKEEQLLADPFENETADVKADLLQNEKSVLHYLAYGSLPPSVIIKEANLPDLIRELLLKSPNKLATLIKENSARQLNFIIILLRLPSAYFKSILSNFLRKSDYGSSQIRTHLKQMLLLTNIPNETKALASVLMTKQLIKEKIVSHKEVFDKSAPFINDSEKRRLAELLSKEDDQFTVEAEDITESSDKDIISPVYLSDLLMFIITNNSWPWWGSSYAKIYGEVDVQKNFEIEIGKIINRFKSIDSIAYSLFSKTLLNELEKPSALFTKLDWTTSLSILDAALPVFRNVFSKTLEAVIALISDKRQLGLHPEIATQQLLLFIIDQQKGNSFNFKEGINEFITLIAVKFNLPLWEAYSILLKHYDELKVNIPLTKTEAINLFQYHENLEEKYVKVAELPERASEFEEERMSSINFISDKQENVILDYLSGKDISLKAFPSAWALGMFIKERLQNSPTFFAILKNSINSNSSKSVHRLIQLEALSKQTWLSNLLDQKENAAFQSDLYLFFENLINGNELKHFIRAAFITEQYWEDKILNAERLRALLKTISTVSGIALTLLELELLKGLSRNNIQAPQSIQHLFQVPDFREQLIVEEPEKKSFLENLKEISYKKQLGSLKLKLDSIKDKTVVAEFLRKLKTSETKSELLILLNKELGFENRSELTEFIRSLNEQAEFPNFVDVMQTVLNSIANPLKQKSTKIDARLSAIENFILYSTEFSQKQSLIQFLETSDAQDGNKLVSFIEKLNDFDDKESVLEFVTLEFSLESNPKKQDLYVISKTQKESLLRFIKELNEFNGKQNLIKIFESDKTFDSAVLISAIERISEVEEKKRIVAFVSKEFRLPENVWTAQHGMIKTNDLLIGEKEKDIVALSDLQATELLRHIEELSNFKGKQVLSEFVKKNRSINKNEFTSLFDSLTFSEKQVFLKFINESVFIKENIGNKINSESRISDKLSIDKTNNAPHILALLSLLEKSADFKEKRTLINFIKTRFNANKEVFSSFIEAMPDFHAKAIMLELIRNEFPYDVSATSLFNSESEEKRFNWWKEKLEFDVAMPITQKTLLADSNRDVQKKEPGQNNLRKQGKKIEEEIQKVNSKKLKSSEDQADSEKHLRAVNALSHESVVDIVLYYFLNGELPWWSSVKELSVLEKLVQDAALQSPFILNKKLNEAVNYQPEFFIEIAKALQSLVQKNVALVSKGEMADLVKQEVDWLKEIYQQNKDLQFPQLLIDQLVIAMLESQAENANLDADVFIRLFIKTLSYTLHIVEFKNIEALQTSMEEYGNKIEERLKESKIDNIGPERWKQLFNEVEQEIQLKNSKFYPLRFALQQIEQKVNKDLPTKDLLVTNNLFLLLDPKEDIAREEMLKTWLAMFEASYGIPAQTVQKAIADFKDDEKLVSEELVESISLLSLSEETILLPYTNYITLLALVLEASNLQETKHKREAVQLFAALLQASRGNLALALNTTLRHLFDKGFTQEVFALSLNTMKNEVTNLGIKESAETMIDILEGKRQIVTYMEDTVEKNISTTKNFSAEEAVDEIIKKIRERLPVLDALELKNKEEQQERKSKRKPEQTEAQKEKIDIDLNDNIYIPNAGLIILWPFFTRLFSNLKYIEEGKFIDAEKQQRAIHLTQYMVGFSEDHPEFTLMLNKLICGVELTEPSERKVSLTEEEKTEAKSLISAVLAQWKEMSNTSVKNFQRTFIQREGLMYQKDGNWYIKVTRTAFDVLLLNLPWGLSIVKYPWNNYLIFVEWKAMS